MTVQNLTSDGDWRLGRGRGDYITRSREVRQRIITRLRSWQNDFFADPGHGVRWAEILGSFSTLELFRNEVIRQVLETRGVATIDRISVNLDRRNGQIDLSYTDVFNVTDRIIL